MELHKPFPLARTRVFTYPLESILATTAKKVLLSKPFAPNARETTSERARRRKNKAMTIINRSPFDTSSSATRSNIHAEDDPQMFFRAWRQANPRLANDGLNLTIREAARRLGFASAMIEIGRCKSPTCVALIGDTRVTLLNSSKEWQIGKTLIAGRLVPNDVEGKVGVETARQALLALGIDAYECEDLAEEIAESVVELVPEWADPGRGGARYEERCEGLLSPMNWKAPSALVRDAAHAATRALSVVGRSHEDIDGLPTLHLAELSADSVAADLGVGFFLPSIPNHDRTADSRGHLIGALAREMRREAERIGLNGFSSFDAAEAAVAIAERNDGISRCNVG